MFDYFHFLDEPPVLFPRILGYLHMLKAHIHCFTSTMAEKAPQLEHINYYVRHNLVLPRSDITSSSHAAPRFKTCFLLLKLTWGVTGLFVLSTCDYGPGTINC